MNKKSALKRKCVSTLLTIALLFSCMTSLATVMADLDDFVKETASTVPAYYQYDSTNDVYLYKNANDPSEDYYRVYGGIEDATNTIDVATLGFYACDIDGDVFDTSSGALKQATELADALFTHVDLSTVPAPYTAKMNAEGDAVYSFKAKDSTTEYRVYGEFLGSTTAAFYISDDNGKVIDADAEKTINDVNDAMPSTGVGESVVPDLIPNEAYVSYLRVKEYETGTPNFDANNEPGNDEKADNMIVRSFDTVKYELEYTTNLQNQPIESPVYFEQGYIYLRFVLPDTTKDRANFNLAAMSGWLENAKITYDTKEDGETDKEDIVLTGRFMIKSGVSGQASIPATGTLPVFVKVFAMNNEEELLPHFYAWMDGYNPDKPGDKVLNNVPFQAEVEKVFISAKLSLNVAITKSNYLEELKTSGTGFDFQATTKTSAINYDAGTNVLGRLLGYGIAVEVTNSLTADPTRGLKGIELPSGPITFEIELKAEEETTEETYNNITNLPKDQGGSLPLLWSYATNGVNFEVENNPTGRNMLWMSSTGTHIARGASSYHYPVNSGVKDIRESVAPAGGNWLIEATSIPSVYKVTISDYGFLNTNGDYQWPLRTPFGEVGSNPVFGEAMGRGMFSTGFIQVLFQKPEGEVEETTNFRLTVQDKELKAASYSNQTAIALTQVRTTDDLERHIFTMYPFGRLSLAHAYTTIADAISDHSPWSRDHNVSTSEGYGADGWMPYGSQVAMFTAIAHRAGSDNSRRTGSFDLLQKFDATYLQPASDSDGTVYNKTSNPGGSVYVSSMQAKMRDNLSVYYVAKNDGLNWSSDAELNGTTLDDLGSDFRIYNTMADLLADTTASKEPRLCVAILYVGRGEDAIVQSDRSYMGSKMDVSDNEDLIGQVGYHTTSLKIWWSEKSLTLDKPEIITDPYFTYSALVNPLETLAPHDDELHPDSYRKTTYDINGVSGGNSGGYVEGGSLLLVGNIATITKSVDQHASDSDHNPKTHWEVTAGQRQVHFVLNPQVVIAGDTGGSSGDNATKTTTVTIIDTLPKELTINPATIFYLGGNYVPNDRYPSSGYIDVGTATIIPLHNNTDTQSVSYQVSEDTPKAGQTTITFIFRDVDVGSTMESIHYSADIGTPGDPLNDVQSGVPFNNTVIIRADGDSRSIVPLHNNIDSYTVNTISFGQSALVKSVVEKILEIEKEINYKISYTNSVNDPIHNFQLLDVLPYNGDGRGTNIHGDYTTDLTIDIVDLDSSLDVYIITADDWDKVNIANVTIDDYAKDVNSLGTIGIKALNDKITSANSGNTKLSLDQDARAVYICGTIGGNKSSININITLKPVNNKGGDIYFNHTTAVVTADTSGYMYAPPVAAVVVARTISGVAWLDDNQNGRRDVNEALLENVMVSLINDTNIIVNNMRGEACTATTDADGYYEFVDLPEGSYKVVFSGNGNDFVISNYSLTKYLEQSVPVTVNSDATPYNPDGILIEGQTIFYSFPVKAQVGAFGYHVRNIDAGFFREAPVLGSIVINKLSPTGAALAKAEFKLSKVNSPDQNWTKETNDKGQILFADLEMGDYELEELTPPAGYVVGNTSTVNITLTDNNLNEVIDVTNYPIIEAEAIIMANKRVTGANLVADQFEFELLDANNLQVSKAKNNANGVIEFPSISYGTKGEYNYTIRELTNSISSSGNWSFDRTVYAVKVIVDDNLVRVNGPGELIATIEYTVPGSQDTTTPPTFVNNYTAPYNPPVNPNNPNPPIDTGTTSLPSEPVTPPSEPVTPPSEPVTPPSEPVTPPIDDTGTTIPPIDDPANPVTPPVNPPVDPVQPIDPQAPNTGDTTTTAPVTPSITTPPPIPTDFSGPIEDYFIFDEDGIPLGGWTWDDDLGEWVFDEDLIPLGSFPGMPVIEPVVVEPVDNIPEFPATGDGNSITLYTMSMVYVLGLFMAVYMLIKRQRAFSK